jgi:hypothetical protein
VSSARATCARQDFPASVGRRQTGSFTSVSAEGVLGPAFTPVTHLYEPQPVSSPFTGFLVTSRSLVNEADRHSHGNPDLELSFAERGGPEN